MTFISVTRLRLRSARFLPPFARHTRRSLAQLRRASGFEDGSLLADRAWTFWTLTAWEAESHMRAYMLSGDHRTAMPHLLAWCDEASVVHWLRDGDAMLPQWAEAARRMRLEGRPSKLRHPGPAHADLSYREPRLSLAVPIRPA